MTRSLITIFYGTVLIVCGATLGAMMVVEYDGTILPFTLAQWLLVSLVGILVCDWLLQYGIRRGYIE
jgi:hypothetical protein